MVLDEAHLLFPNFCSSTITNLLHPVLGWRCRSWGYRKLHTNSSVVQTIDTNTLFMSMLIQLMFYFPLISERICANIGLECENCIFCLHEFKLQYCNCSICIQYPVQNSELCSFTLWARYVCKYKKQGSICFNIAAVQSNLVCFFLDKRMSYLPNYTRILKGDYRN